jgi:Outer membrane protein beta-barrel domain
MNGVLKTLLGMTVLLLPALSSAQQTPTQPFSYNYAELAYDESDFDLGGGEIDGDGLTLSGSWAINDDWHVYGAYATADLDFGLDYDAWALGAGYRYPLQDDVDLYGRVLYIDAEADSPGPGSASEDGLGLQVRIRFRVNDEFEVEGGIQHTDVFDSDTSLQAMARYHFTDNFSAGLGLTFAGDTDSFGINARYSF